MSYTFKPLWKLLIDTEITREQLYSDTKVPSATMTKLAKVRSVTFDALAQERKVLNVQLSVICLVGEKEGTRNVEL